MGTLVIFCMESMSLDPSSKGCRLTSVVPVRVRGVLGCTFLWRGEACGGRVHVFNETEGGKNDFQHRYYALGSGVFWSYCFWCQSCREFWLCWLYFEVSNTDSVRSVSDLCRLKSWGKRGLGGIMDAMENKMEACAESDVWVFVPVLLLGITIGLLIAGVLMGSDQFE